MQRVGTRPGSSWPLTSSALQCLPTAMAGGPPWAHSQTAPCSFSDPAWRVERLSQRSTWGPGQPLAPPVLSPWSSQDCPSGTSCPFTDTCPSWISTSSGPIVTWTLGRCIVEKGAGALFLPCPTSSLWLPHLPPSPADSVQAGDSGPRVLGGQPRWSPQHLPAGRCSGPGSDSGVHQRSGSGNPTRRHRWLRDAGAGSRAGPQPLPGAAGGLEKRHHLGETHQL